MRAGLRAVIGGLTGLWLTAASAVTIEKVTSAQGIEAWLVEDHNNPIIACHFSFAVGAASDPDGKSGLAAMAADLLDEGAGDLDSQAYQGRLEDLAIALSFAVDTDNFSGQLKTLSENRDSAFHLLGLALTAPRFDEAAVERVRGQTLTAIKQEEQEPQALANHALAAALFADHPYGRTRSSDTVLAITRTDLAPWVPTHLAKDRLVIGVVGDITPLQLAGLLDSTFGGLPATVSLPPIPDISPPTQGRTLVIRRPIPQSVVEFGKSGIKRGDPDWYNATVMNYILGGGSFSSRLMTEVRVKRGLAYGVSTSLMPYRHAGVLEGEVATRNDKVTASLAVIKDEWRRMESEDVSAAELSAAKTYLNGAFPLQMDSTRSIASLLVAVQKDHLGIDYFDRRASLISSVDAPHIRAVAKRLLDPDALTIVVVGDPPGTLE
jgi:zinc protease